MFNALRTKTLDRVFCSDLERVLGGVGRLHFKCLSKVVVVAGKVETWQNGWKHRLALHGVPVDVLQ